MQHVAVKQCRACFVIELAVKAVFDGQKLYTPKGKVYRLVKVN